MATLRAQWQGPGIMHCFTGDATQATEALAMGFHLAYGGVLTFRTAENVREAARITPDEISEKALEALFFTPPPPIADDPDE